MEYTFKEQIREIPPYRASVLGCMVKLFFLVTVVAFAVMVVYMVLYFGGKIAS